VTYPYRADEIDSLVSRSMESIGAELLCRPRVEPRDITPIFVVGMPRAGSTLIEQILASHPEIEATSELPHLIGIANFLDDTAPAGTYPKNLHGLSLVQLTALGDLYLKHSESDRRLGRRFFVDKNPNNWRNVGLIRTILPAAKIIDIRRHPLDCGFSNYRQLYVSGHEFSYSLETIGHYYSRYVQLMAHWDAVAPQAVHRVIYEELVDDPEKHIRALLDYVGVPFAVECLNFHRTQRSIRTPSSEQVKRPINREGMDRWKLFDPWLDPLRDSLGPVLTSYPFPPRDYP